MDNSNQGPSWITGAGSWKGGETLFFNEDSATTHRLSEDIPKVGPTGILLSREARQINGMLWEFDGKQPHGTLPFVGERHAMIAFCVGTSMYDRTPVLVQAMSSELGFRLPRQCLAQPSATDFAVAKLATAGFEVTLDNFQNDVAEPEEEENKHTQSKMNPDAPEFFPAALNQDWATPESKPGLPASAVDGQESSLEEVSILQQPLPDPAANHKIDEYDDYAPSEGEE